MLFHTFMVLMGVRVRVTRLVRNKVNSAQILALSGTGFDNRTVAYKKRLKLENNGGLSIQDEQLLMVWSAH